MKKIPHLELLSVVKRQYKNCQVLGSEAVIRETEAKAMKIETTETFLIEDVGEYIQTVVSTYANRLFPEQALSDAPASISPNVRCRGR